VGVAEHELENLHFRGFDRFVGNIFRKVEKSFLDLGRWVRRVIGETPAQKAQSRTEAIFQTLRDGLLREGLKPSGQREDARLEDEDSLMPYANHRRRMSQACG